MARDPALHTRETRLRRSAERQGVVVSKKRRFDPRATDFQQWTVTTVRGRVLVKGSLDDAEAFLYGPPAK